jgi:hypothetical protein
MAEAKPLKYDKVLLLGDLVGYGAIPTRSANACATYNPTR